MISANQDIRLLAVYLPPPTPSSQIHACVCVCVHSEIVLQERETVRDNPSLLCQSRLLVELFVRVRDTRRSCLLNLFSANSTVGPFQTSIFGECSSTSMKVRTHNMHTIQTSLLSGPIS